MQLRHVSTNLRQGLRRNLSMHAAVILTLFVSLSLSGIGLMLSKQADLTAEVLGNELQIQVYLCVGDETAYPQCTSEVTPAQEAAVIDTIEENPEVEGYELLSKAEAFDNLKKLLGDEQADQLEGPDAIITADDLPESYRITLKDPDEFQGIESALVNLDGVRNVENAKDLVGGVFTLIDRIRYAAWGAAGILVLAAVMMVANTIRLAALARRKEIEIMRLVGASRLFIALPFLLEAFVTAVVGVALAGGALAAFTKWGIIGGLDDQINALPFIGWPEYLDTLVVIAIAGPILTVIPTLLLTRKYLRF